MRTLCTETPFSISLKNRQVYLWFIQPRIYFACARDSITLVETLSWSWANVASNWPEKCLIRIILCSEKIGKAEAVQSKRKKLGLEQSVPLIHTFEALHNFSGKGIWLSRRSIVWLWKESFVKRKLCFWKFLFEPHQPQKNILISLICFHRGATTWSPVFFELDDKTERRSF